jgi:hypothetical protein
MEKERPYGESIGAYVLDENGEPRIAQTREEWAEFMERRGSRHVGYDTLIVNEKEYTVSTVFLGLDYSMGRGDSLPQFFETMIFTKDRGALDYQERYTTKEEALIGHEEAIKFAKQRN